MHMPEAGEGHLANIRQLTFGGNNAEAYFSRDGRSLIFQRQDSVGRGCDQQFIMRIDGSGVRRVSNGQGRTTCGYFIDGDRRIIFSSTHGHDTACPTPPDRSLGYVWPLGHFELYTAKPDGSDLRQLTRTGAYNAEATASPDGKQVVFTSTRDGDVDLYVMNIDGSGVRRLTSRVGYDGGAFFSPDGKSIVWRAQYPVTASDSSDYRRLLGERLVRPSRLELWMADADGSNPRQVTRLGAANFAPFFHPDGKRIIFASNWEDPHGRDFELYLVKTDGTGVERVTRSRIFDGFRCSRPTAANWCSHRTGMARPMEKRPLHRRLEGVAMTEAKGRGASMAAGSSSGSIDRGGTGRVAGAADLPARGLPDPVRQHAEHAARG